MTGLVIVRLGSTMLIFKDSDHKQHHATGLLSLMKIKETLEQNETTQDNINKTKMKLKKLNVIQITN